MAQTIQTFNGTGADCSGSSGDSNRVLTLSNTKITSQAGFLVYVSGLALGLTTEYTVVHNATGTQITFLNGLWDDMTIVVQYFEDVASTNYSKMRTDIQGIIHTHGQTFTLIRETLTTDSMGATTSISEDEYTIVAVIQDITKKDRKIHEMGLAIPGNVKAYFYHEYPNSITGNGTVSVQVGDILKDSDSRHWRVEQILGERYSYAYEIFRTGVLKKVDLDQ